MLSNEKAILLIRGEKPVIDLKYDIMKHPNVKYTADGDGKIYEHGVVDKATATISILDVRELQDLKYTEGLEEIESTNYELLSEEDVEKYFIMEELENEERNKEK